MIGGRSYAAGPDAAGPGPSTRWATLFGLFLLFLYGPMLVIYLLSFQGPNGGVTFPMVGTSLVWFEDIVKPGQMANIPVVLRALDRARLGRQPADGGDLGRRRAWLPPALSRLRRRCSISPSPAW